MLGKSFHLWANLIACNGGHFRHITNRILVFRSEPPAGSVAAEFLEFIGARLATLGIEEAGLWLLVGRLSCNENVSKVGLNVLVVILNFFFSKWIVFRKKERKPKDTEDPS